MENQNITKITSSGLTADEINLFKSDPEAFKEYLKYKMYQMDIGYKLYELDHQRQMKAMDERSIQQERKYKDAAEVRKAAAEEDERKYKAEAEADERRYKAEAEADQRREDLWMKIIVGAGAVCDFLANRDTIRTNMENREEILGDLEKLS